MSIRGGGSSEDSGNDEEDRELDDYVAQLIANIDDSSEGINEGISNGKEDGEILEMGDEIKVAPSVEESSAPLKQETAMDEATTLSEEVSTHSNGNLIQGKKRKKKKRKSRTESRASSKSRSDSSVTSQLSETLSPPMPTVNTTTEIPNSNITSVMVTPTIDNKEDCKTLEETNLRPKILPPSRIQQFLLSKGKVGRALAALSILISQFIHTYLPELYKVGTYLTSLLFPDSDMDYYRHGGGKRKRNGKKMHSKYAAFAGSASSGTVGGKKMSSEQKKALDNEALHKLENLSKRPSTDGQGMGTSGGKYHHLSVAFMTR